MLDRRARCWGEVAIEVVLRDPRDSWRITSNAFDSSTLRNPNPSPFSVRSLHLRCGRRSRRRTGYTEELSLQSSRTARSTPHWGIHSLRSPHLSICAFLLWGSLVGLTEGDRIGMLPRSHIACCADRLGFQDPPIERSNPKPLPSDWSASLGDYGFPYPSHHHILTKVPLHYGARPR